MNYNSDFIKDVIKELTKEVASEVYEMESGEMWEKNKGSYTREIDEEAYKVSVNFLQDEINEEGVLAFGGEDADWRDACSSSEVKEVDEYDFAVLMDFVEGTKNTGKGRSPDVYTTAVLFSPGEDILSSSIYRWDGTEFFYDGIKSTRNGEVDKVEKVDEIDDCVNVRGGPILKYMDSYGAIAEFLIEEFSIDEKDQPMLKSDGTTTGSLIGTVRDQSIDVDPRVLFEDAERTAFTHDLAPAAVWAKNLGVEIYDFDGEEINIDPREDEPVSYIALPPGKLREEIRNKLPQLKERLLEDKG